MDLVRRGVAAVERARRQVQDGDQIGLADAVMLGDQVVLLAVGVVGFERGGGVEVGQQPRLPLGASLIEYLAYLAADPYGRRGEPRGVDGTDNLCRAGALGRLPDLRPFERVFEEAST